MSLSTIHSTLPPRIRCFANLLIGQLLLGLFCLTSGQAFGQPTPPSKSETAPAGLLIQTTKLVRFDVINGRIVARDARFGQSRSASANQSSEIHGEETLRLQLKGGEPAVLYERQKGTLVIRLQAQRSGPFHLQVTRADDKYQLDFTQQLDVRCRLTISANGTEKQIDAACLWHLMVEEPFAFSEHLRPWIEQLRIDWDFNRDLRKIESQLIRQSRKTPHAMREQVEQLVSQLGSNRFAKRQSAHRQLVAMGHLAVGYLTTSMATTSAAGQTPLTVEQRKRISVVLRQIRGLHSDSPDRVASRLYGETAIWETLARRADPSLRLVASRRLQQLR